MKLLRQAGTVSERGSRETIAVLVARLSKLRPRSAPSMSNLFSCPACDQRMKIAEELSGKQVKCPYCKQIIRVPAAATPPPVSTVDFRPPAKTSGSGKLEATVDLHPTRETHKQFLEFLLAGGTGRVGPIGAVPRLEGTRLRWHGRRLSGRGSTVAAAGGAQGHAARTGRQREALANDLSARLRRRLRSGTITLSPSTRSARTAASPIWRWSF